MGDAIIVASELLHTALEQYSIDCGSIPGADLFHAQEGWSNNLHQQLLDQVVNDIQQLETHEHILSQATSNLKRLRNFRLSPIHTLPEDILITIFQFVLGFRPCIIDKGSAASPKLACPGLLSRVCFRWRQVAINTQILWSHIDIPLNALPFQDLLDRAKLFATRASDIPLLVHLARLTDAPKLDEILPELELFLSSITTLMHSLELYAIHTSDYGKHDVDARILAACFRVSKPGILTELTFRNTNNHHYFLCPRDCDQRSHNSVRMPLPHAQLEDLWGPITVLRLCGLLPYWTSRAYHNLTELHLEYNGKFAHMTPISESQLIGILRASPKLRVFSVALAVRGALPKGAPIKPVHLKDLEVLSIVTCDYDTILRWCFPGLLPLRLLLKRTRAGTFGLDKDIGDFRIRSKITHLRLITTILSYQEVANTLTNIPSLQTLALDRCFCRHDTKQQNIPQPSYDNRKPPAFCMVRCCADIEGFQWIVARELVSKLTLWRCSFGHDSDQLNPTTFVTQHNFYHEFSSCPGIKFLTEEQPDPVGDWF